MKKYNLILGLVLSFFLVSCGSSNDGSSSNSEATNRVTGNSIDIEGFKITDDTSDHKILVLNGQPVKVGLLADSVYTTLGIAYVRDPEVVSNNSKYKDSIFGYIIRQGGRGGIYFSQGNETQDMPASGVLTYKGDAASVISSGEKKILSTQLLPANFEVNFTERKLTGSIKNITITKVRHNKDGNAIVDRSSHDSHFQAKIDGNKFEGEYNRNEIRGGFYGQDAKEMSGVFKLQLTDPSSNSQVSGAFGAIKQE